MRILLVEPGPHFSVADVCNGWAVGLRQAGAQVVQLNLGDRLEFYARAHINLGDGQYRKALSDEDAVSVAVKGVETACYEVWPDVVLVVSGFYLPPAVYELMRLRGHRVALLCTEQPYELDREIRLAPLVDMVLLNDPTHIEQFQAVNPNVWYFPHAYDPDVHYPSYGRAAHDFTFVGTGFESRIRFLEKVCWDGLDVVLAGNWQQLDDGSPLRQFVAHDLDECISNRQAADLYRWSRSSANLYRREAQRPELSQGWAVGPREVELAACAVPFLRDPRPEGDQLFPGLPTFDSPEEFAEKLRWLIANEDVARKLGHEARQAIADRTFTNSAKRLLRLLDKE